MRKIKKGKLYWFEIDCQDIEKFILPRVFRKIGVDYIPFTLRFYEQVFLREDRSKYNRKLVEFCKKRGIETLVVQEGDGPSSDNPWGHLPLRADYFLCPESDKKWWLEQGMPKDRIQTYIPQKPTRFYTEVCFLHPLYTADSPLHQSFWNYKNVMVMNVICTLLKSDKVVFKLHNKNKDLVRRFIPPHRIVEGDALDLMQKYRKVYCFSDSSIKRDCETLGIPFSLLDFPYKDIDKNADIGWGKNKTC